jgi:hypothetical protein
MFAADTQSNRHPDNTLATPFDHHAWAQPRTAFAPVSEPLWNLDPWTTDLANLSWTPEPWNFNFATMPLADPSSTISPANSFSNSTLIKLDNGRFQCTMDNCRRSFARKADATRHHRSKHLPVRDFFFCGWAGCERQLRGFPRKDKRDDHERKIHGGVFQVGEEEVL